MRFELLPDGHVWLRIAEVGWSDPLDPTFAAVRGGRWNPPNSHRTLYLNEDRTTARLNLRSFIGGWPYEPEDLRDDTGPVLVRATLPAGQRVADAHSRAGVAALGLPAGYPLDGVGGLVTHAVCQPIGVAAKEAGLRGVRARSARAPEGAGRELAWFPATARSRARLLGVETFETWYWG
ncbi:MAG TPA: RES family NAD+ phosphorylase [Candidatus Sulfomarinibacteraceae bacterium]|nr:RES family NAD+ phosphorylase [Candidatus Sulfomarinibacteraceae bacterium]